MSKHDLKVEERDGRDFLVCERCGEVQDPLGGTLSYPCPASER